MRSIFTALRDYFFPHKRNAYRPHFFNAKSVAIIAVCMLLLECAYFAHISLLFRQTDFLTSVLPGVLTMLTNQERDIINLPKLEEDLLLNKAAQKKAEDMARRGYFAHTSPDGKTPWYWLDEVGYRYSYAGENLAMNFVDSEDVEKAWVASPSHYGNIIKPQFTKTGVGVARGMYQNKETIFVAQFFATPAFDSPRVLAAESEPNFLQKIAASPRNSVAYVIVAALLFFFALFLIAVFVKIRIQHRSVFAGGLALIILALSLLALNYLDLSSIEIPNESQSASASFSTQ